MLCYAEISKTTNFIYQYSCLWFLCLNWHTQNPSRLIRVQCWLDWGKKCQFLTPAWYATWEKRSFLLPPAVLCGFVNCPSLLTCLVFVILKTSVIPLVKQNSAKLESQWKHCLEYMLGMVNTSRTHWMFLKQNAQFVIKHHSQI